MTYLTHQGKIINFPNFQTETVSLLSRMTIQPKLDLMLLIDKTIKDLKTEGIWNHIDVLRFMNLHTQQASLLNWKTSDFGNGTNVNGLGWIAKLGFKGYFLGDNKYIDSGFNPLTQGINYTQNNAFYGAFVSELFENASVAVIYLSSTTYCSPRGSSANSYRARCLTNNTALTLSDVPATSIGFTVAARASSTSSYWYKNGIAQDSDADNSVAITDANFKELGGNASSISYAARVQCTVYGGGLTDAKHLSLYNILKYFNDNVGGTF